MIPKSIRWRLPLSYAAIALLGAVSLGVVLLMMLRGYYLQRELDYLTSNAQAIGSRIGLLMEAELPPAALQSQLRSFSFLSQTRVRLLDVDGQVLADSGSPGEHREVATISVEVEVGGLSEVLTQTVEGDDEEKRYTSMIVIEDASTEDVQLSESVMVKGSGPGGLAGVLETDEGLTGGRGLVSLIPAVGTPYGFGLTAGAEVDGPRSTQVVRHPFYTELIKLRGYVELSEGPAYGRQVLTSVTWGWAVASGVAVLLAAGVGWIISRRLSAPLLALTDVTARIADGDLSARAGLARQDELGLLAHSFNEMAGRVEETVVALRYFVADAAHELHTPLTALRTDLELVTGVENDAERHTHIERAQAQVERLEALTSGLLDLSHLEAGTVDEDRAPVNLNALIRETSEPYASRAEQADLSFSLSLPEEAAVVQGYEAQLRRALSNLLDNAVKFTPEGGAVSAGVCRDGEWVELWVQDTGIGIPTEDLPHLFSRFHRGRNTAAYPGSGLGLAIVKAIAECHNGDVRAENTAQGARFTLRLPVQQSAA